MIIFRDWCIFLGVAAPLAYSLAAGGMFTYRLDPPTIQPGQRATLEVRLPLSLLGEKDWNDDEAETPQLRDDLLVDAKSLLLLGREVKREGDAFVWRYEVSAYLPGKYTVPPVEVRMGPQSFSTEAMSFEVKSTRADQDVDIREEFGPLSHRWRWEVWLLRFAVLAGVFFLFRWLKKFLPKRKPHVVPTYVDTTPAEAPEAWLRRRLHEIRVRGSGAAAQSLDELTDSVREYFARKARVPARAWTTRELGDKLADTRVPAIRKIFERCDAYKFSGNTSIPLDHLLESALDETERVILA